jgi:hypothetical protein
MNLYIKSLFVSFLAFNLCVLNLTAADFYVDNVLGNDNNTGTKDKPFKSLEKAIKALKSSDILHLVNTQTPYKRKNDRTFWVIHPGTSEQPTIIDGHGATVSGLTHYVDNWQQDTDGLYCMKLKNNYQNFRKDAYWIGFDLVFFDGKPGVNYKSKEELKKGNDFGYYLHCNRYLWPERKERDPLLNTLYVKLPTGKTPKDIKIEAPGDGSNICIGSNHVVVKNFKSEYSCADGFSGSRNIGVRFENVRGCYNMDQGISHHGTQSTVINSEFDHNGNCGIVDVYPEARVKYINCFIHDNPSRGGVEFLRGEFEMQNCTIQHNDIVQLAVKNQAKVSIKNCLIIGLKDEKKSQCISIDGSFKMDNCVIKEASTGIFIGKKTSAQFTNNIIFDCDLIYREWDNKTSSIEFKNNYSSLGEVMIKKQKYKLNTMLKDNNFTLLSNQKINELIKEKYSNIGFKETLIKETK